MKDRLVTVIGGGGFLGRYVVRDLLNVGARVRIAERDPRRALFLKPQGGLGQTQFVAADVTRPDTLARAIQGSHAVVNLAGSFADPDGVQAKGAGHVAAAAADAGASALAHISAIGTDAESESAYGRSKAEGEAAVRGAFPQATILRPSIMFGREDQFINRFARMLALPVVPVVRPGVKFQPVFVGDAASAVAAALADPGAHGGKTYELGGPDVLSMDDLFRWIADRTGRHPNFVDLPDTAAKIIARLPGSPISWDQWLMLQRDNVVTGENGLTVLGVERTPLDAVAPGWLVQYRRHGRFAKTVAG
ncbi:complex I NDUFA9 subunit family protein [Sphingomonas gilva]|uniref:Complex I NDUFA9 subunit family protein n=1 Tax=Sphingomonas gilva TaxID=2305907 RepID=A0A396RR55_9SPHN|nr:complex I NDUFA9 subunit family protein [Sphingomonas gilva]RHW17772.1 complex I NDUFA9 subunit family protein [Sphingomonas gilva]